MAVQAKDFTFDGVSLSSIGADFVLVTMDSSPTEIDVDYFNEQVNRSDFNYDVPVTHFYNKYGSDVLKFEITIAHDSGKPLTAEDIIKLNKWLLAPKTPKVAYFTPYDDCGDYSMYKDVDYIGVFVGSKYSSIGQVGKIAVTYSFENISHYAFSKQEVYNMSPRQSNDASVVITGGGSSGEYSYPEIIITPNSNCIVTIKNNDVDQDAFSITVQSGVEIIISDFNIRTTNEGALYSFDNVNNLYFPFLIDGENHLTITGDADVTFKVRFCVNIGY
jgi:hypothetical protein